MCTPSPKYLSLLGEQGPPVRGCLAPFIDDVSDLFGNLGWALTASGVFFLLMIIFVLPICCLKRPSIDEDMLNDE